MYPMYHHPSGEGGQIAHVLDTSARRRVVPHTHPAWSRTAAQHTAPGGGGRLRLTRYERSMQLLSTAGARSRLRYPPRVASIAR
eukprot:6552620-Prymnesium_polylepis.1